MPLNLIKLEKSIKIKFNNTELLKKAFTHSSYVVETGINEHNERLEFLGDSVLGLVVANFLFEKYPNQDEGKLSQLKSQIVSGQNISQWAKKIKLGDYVFMSKGEEANGGRLKESLLANTLESLIAAIYIDVGFPAAKLFILNFLSKQRRLVVNEPKSKLQEYTQLHHRTLPEYRVMNVSGPDHHKVFEMGVYIKKELVGTGSGHSKKEAEQQAAKNALKQFAKDKKNKIS